MVRNDTEDLVDAICFAGNDDDLNSILMTADPGESKYTLKDLVVAPVLYAKTYPKDPRGWQAFVKLEDYIDGEYACWAVAISEEMGSIRTFVEAAPLQQRHRVKATAEWFNEISKDCRDRHKTRQRQRNKLGQAVSRGGKGWEAPVIENIGKKALQYDVTSGNCEESNNEKTKP